LTQRLKVIREFPKQDSLDLRAAELKSLYKQRDELLLTIREKRKEFAMLTMQQMGVDAQLSLRERQVAALVSEELLNKEIGEKLCISVRTVKAHLAAIFKELNITNRRELRGLIPVLLLFCGLAFYPSNAHAQSTRVGCTISSNTPQFNTTKITQNYTGSKGNLLVIGAGSWSGTNPPGTTSIAASGGLKLSPPLQETDSYEDAVDQQWVIADGNMHTYTATATLNTNLQMAICEYSNPNGFSQDGTGAVYSSNGAGVTAVPTTQNAASSGDLGVQFSVNRANSPGGSETCSNGTLSAFGNYQAFFVCDNLSLGSSSDTITMNLNASAQAAGTMQLFASASGIVASTPTPLSISANLPTGTIGQSYTGSVTSAGGTPPYTYAATSLPTGLSISALSGAVTGTPIGFGTFSTTITVTDSSVPIQTAQQTVPIPVPAASVVTQHVVSLYWTPISGATSYVVRRSVSGGNLGQIAAVAGTAYADSNVQTGQSYCYEVDSVPSADQTAGVSQVMCLTVN